MNQHTKRHDEIAELKQKLEWQADKIAELNDLYVGRGAEIERLQREVKHWREAYEEARDLAKIAITRG